MPKADMMAGMPTLTTVTSSTAMNVPIIIRLSTHHLYPLPRRMRSLSPFIPVGGTKKVPFSPRSGEQQHEHDAPDDEQRVADGVGDRIAERGDVARNRVLDGAERGGRGA